jgi:hypothetical protein
MPIGDRAREENIVCSETKQIFRRICVKLDGSSLEGVDFSNCLYDENLKFTNGVYEIAYKPVTKQREFARRNPFLIRSDLLPGCKMRFKDWKDFCKLAESNKALKWLKEWTTISAEMFNCAKTHYMLPLVFTVKYCEYWKRLKKLEPEARMHLSREEWMIGDKYRAERLASR